MERARGEHTVDMGVVGPIMKTFENTILSRFTLTPEWGGVPKTDFLKSVLLDFAL